MDLEVWTVSNMAPPMHGVAAFNAMLVDELERRGIRHRMFRIGTRGDLQQIARIRIGKAATDAATIARLGWAGLGRSRDGEQRPVLYFTPCQGGSAVLRDLVVTRLGRALGLPIVAHLHGCAWLEVRARGGWQAHAMLDVLAACDRVICLGPSFATRMIAATNAACVGINNGVPSPPQVARRPVPRRDRPIELLHLSNLGRRKGLWQVAGALRALLRRGRAAHLRCAGNWSFEPERAEFIADFASELNAGSIELVGYADESAKGRLFSEAHFSLLPIPSTTEGQPLALIEAMAHAVVPLTTPSGGIPDLFGFDGWEVLCSRSHDDPERLADTVLSMSADPVTYREASARCLERQRSALTMVACADAILRELKATRMPRQG
jgi:glycosyltransferase involved in cell wall biosynthesis